MNTKPTIAILGDYEKCLRRFADWSTLEQKANIQIHHEPLQGEALYEVIKHADAIAIVRDRAPINAAMIERLPKLRFVMFTGARNNTLDTAALATRHIPVGVTAGGPSKETTAELTWALILAASKNIIDQQALLQEGQWRNSNSVLPMLNGERLGIIGLGAIGSNVANVGRAFGMEIVTWSPNMTPERAEKVGAKAVSLEELLSSSKIVSLHIVASPSTQGLIHAENLKLMRPDSLLVNTSRSALIKTADLIQALQLGRPGKAAIDVFDIEPIPKNDPLRSTPNLLMTPHLGFIAEPIFKAFAHGINETLLAWTDDKPIPKLLNTAN
ncbi:MAG: D-2-hydroxyacid dehydrogenase family protein [Polynucleobacter sp.]|jgi:phosphoglycerate dehydrogenase-like enzyme|nr:D-2-hydroxyacid dehydrogenase family protein [Polynucleobacter sp.]